MAHIDKDEIVGLTEKYGGKWGLNHTRRLLSLIAAIDSGIQYDKEIVWIAAHLHDWGAYAPWQQAGIDHAQRSGQVVEAFWKEHAYPAEMLALLRECIETHHSGDPGRHIESILLSDADTLDFLGVVGVLRDFSKNPKDLRQAYDAVQMRKAKLPGNLCLGASRKIAAERLNEMERLLKQFDEETFGYF